MKSKKTLLRWVVTILTVIMLAACGSSSTSSPAGNDVAAEKTATGEVTFKVQFPQAALKRALMDNRTVAIDVAWYDDNSGSAISSLTLNPDPATGLASATVAVPVGNVRFTATARDFNGMTLDQTATAGEIVSGNNPIYLTFLAGDWQFVGADGITPTPQSFTDQAGKIVTFEGFSLKSQYAPYAAKAAFDYSKQSAYSPYYMQLFSGPTTPFNTAAMYQNNMYGYQEAQFNSLGGSGGNHFFTSYINITEPTRSNWPSPTGYYNDPLYNFAKGDRIVSFHTDEYKEVISDGMTLGNQLYMRTFEGLTYTPITPDLDCRLYYAQQSTPAAARAAAITASRAKVANSAQKAVVGDEELIGPQTYNYTSCYEDYSLPQNDSDIDNNFIYEELTSDLNNNGYYDSGDTFIDSDGDGRWDYAYYPGTTYDVTEEWSNIVTREYRAKGSQLGSVFTPTVPVAPAAFSTAWLSGKTFYVVWFGEGRDLAGNPLMNVPVVLQVTFNADGTTTANGLMNENGGSGTYGVTAFGLLYDDGDQTRGNTIVSSSTDQYIKTHYTVNGVLDNVDLFFYNQADAMAFASTLTASIPPSGEIQASAVGTWITYNTATASTAILTFIDNNNYMMGEDGTLDTTGAPGIEVGTYIFDPATSATTFTASYETNGDRGATTVGFPTTYPVLGLTESTLTIADPGDGTPFSFSRVVPDPTNPIIGSWYFTGTGMGSTILVLLSDGQYFAIQVDDIDTNNRFFERGTFTWDSVTGTFVGTGVFSSNPANSAIAAPNEINTTNVTVSGNTMYFYDGVSTYTATRL